MKTLLIALITIVVLAGCEASSPETLIASQRAYYKRIMPVGAELLEIVPRTVAVTNVGIYSYAIIKFRGECLLFNAAGHGISMTNIACPNT